MDRKSTSVTNSVQPPTTVGIVGGAPFTLPCPET